jgi:hypothetical protein
MLTVLAVTRLGFRPDTVAVAGGQDSIVVYLRAAPVRLAALEVESERTSARARFEDLAQLSTMSLSAPEIKRAPALLEPDLFRVIQMLPGIVSRNDYSTGYNVRGGESDQNLVQVDGIPVFNPSHLVGLFSTFDPDAIGQADFLTGGFPAGYSGRLSSVLDVALRPGNSREVRASSLVSLLSSKVLLEGPLPGSASFLVSARRTYLDAVVSAFTDEVLPYYFTDLLGKVQARTAGQGTLSFTGYWGRDDLRMTLVEETDTRDPIDLAWHWGNRLLGATWRRPVGAGQFEIRAGYSDFTTTLGLFPGIVQWNNTARLVTAGTALDIRLAATHAIRIGAGLERYGMDNDIRSPAFGTVLMSADYAPTVWSLFADEQWSPFEAVVLRPGVRLEHVPESGFTGLSPRVAAKVFLNRNVAVTASAGRYYQPIHSIRDQEMPVTVYEVWIGADSVVPVARSDHMVLGLESWVGRHEQVTLEGYRKSFSGLVAPNRGQDLRRPGDEFLPASGHAWGVDLLFRRHAGAVRGWLAYTYAHAWRTSEGITYPAAHDRRHTLNIVVELPGVFGGSMALRWGYGSPLPYTGFVGEWFHRRYNVTDHVFESMVREVLAGPRNGERYPPYSRLDLGMRWSFRTLGATWEPYLQFVNLYNRRNVFLYFFDYGNSPPTRTGLSQLPFLPALGVEIRL